jgi:hypothetical protein
MARFNVKSRLLAVFVLEKTAKLAEFRVLDGSLCLMLKIMRTA